MELAVVILVVGIVAAIVIWGTLSEMLGWFTIGRSLRTGQARREQEKSDADEQKKA